MKFMKLVVVTIIDVILFVPRVICWHGGDLLTKIGAWERGWYRS